MYDVAGGMAWQSKAATYILYLNEKKTHVAALAKAWRSYRMRKTYGGIILSRKAAAAAKMKSGDIWRHNGNGVMAMAAA